MDDFKNGSKENIQRLRLEKRNKITRAYAIANIAKKAVFAIAILLIIILSFYIVNHTKDDDLYIMNYITSKYNGSFTIVSKEVDSKNNMTYIIKDENGIEFKARKTLNTRTDDYMMSPVSSKENGLVTNGLPLIAALVYRLLNLFSDISIELVVYYLNAVICSLAAIPAYLYVRKQTNFIGGIVSACLAVIAIPFLEHSVAGYFDTDAMLCTVPLCVITAFALMVGEDNRTKKIAYAIIAVIMFALLAATWETFYVYFGILGFLCVVTVFEL